MDLLQKGSLYSRLFVAEYQPTWWPQEVWNSLNASSNQNIDCWVRTISWQVGTAISSFPISAAFGLGKPSDVGFRHGRYGGLGVETTCCWCRCLPTFIYNWVKIESRTRVQEWYGLTYDDVSTDDFSIFPYSALICKTIDSQTCDTLESEERVWGRVKELETGTWRVSTT